MSPTMHFFFSAGEPSGDQHAAHLIEELKRRCPGVRISGYGGPRMQQAGCELQYQLTDLAVMGFFRVVPLLWKFARLLWQAQRFFARERPDAVVLVDFPGFNWWIARKAKAAGIPVFYYMPPQLWAWAAWRIRRVRKFVDCVLCGLPFEYEWYARRGVDAVYVGHPFFDDVAAHSLDGSLRAPLCSRPSTATGDSSCLPSVNRAGRVVGVLPGSRRHEVVQNWPLMVDVMRRLHARHPDVRFFVPCYKPAFEQMCVDHLRRTEADLPVCFFVGKTPEIIEAADCCLMVSGSVSLEMLARATPAAVIYRLPRLHRLLMPLLVHAKFISLPNLIAGRRVIPEWIVSWTPQRDLEEITATLDGWLSDPARCEAVAAELSALRDHTAAPGATARAAEIILNRTSRPAMRTAA